MNDTTYSRISTITPEMVHARLQSADGRVKAAARNMVDRLHRRGVGVVAPSDMPPLPLPVMPPVPPAVIAVCTQDGYSYWSRGADRAAALTAVHRDSIGATVSQLATPAQLVAAIHAADAYAYIFERAAGDYHMATNDAVAAHVSAQADAVRELVGLVAQCGAAVDGKKV